MVPYSQPAATSCRDAEEELPGAASHVPGYFRCQEFRHISPVARTTADSLRPRRRPPAQPATLFHSLLARTGGRGASLEHPVPGGSEVARSPGPVAFSDFCPRPVTSTQLSEAIAPPLDDGGRPEGGPTALTLPQCGSLGPRPVGRVTAQSRCCSFSGWASRGCREGVLACGATHGQ